MTREWVKRALDRLEAKAKEVMARLRKEQQDERRKRGQTRACLWCGHAVKSVGRGRPALYCCKACRTAGRRMYNTDYRRAYRERLKERGAL